MLRTRVSYWLRIAIGWGSLVTALLIAGLWIRSTFYADAVRVPLGNGCVAYLSSANGELVFWFASSRSAAKLEFRSRSIDFCAGMVALTAKGMMVLANTQREALLDHQAALRSRDLAAEVDRLQLEISAAESKIAEGESLLRLSKERDGWMMTNSLLAVMPHSRRPKQYLGFGFLHERKLLAMALPNWFAISICTAIAAITLLKLRPRFSLRTFLGAATLFALALGIAAARNQP